MNIKNIRLENLLILLVKLHMPYLNILISFFTCPGMLLDTGASMISKRLSYEQLFEFQLFCFWVWLLTVMKSNLDNLATVKRNLGYGVSYGSMKLPHWNILASHLEHYKSISAA